MGPTSEVSSGHGLRGVRIGIDLGGTKIEGIALDGSRQCARLRIDTPRDGAKRKAGTVTVAGVAWAQHRGIKQVEVQVDGGAWAPATLAPAVSADTWVQWSYQWPATAGKHAVRVRATDSDGQTQPSTPAPPAPDGATGWHSVQVTVD